MPEQKTLAPAPQKEIDPVREVGSMLLKSLGSPVMRQALPKHLTPERILRLTITAVQRAPDLLKCSPYSIVGAAVQASQLGLEIDAQLGHAYLVPFRNKHTKQLEATFIAGYRGLVQLAYRSGLVERIDGSVVWKGDKFKYQKGTDERIDHVPGEGVDRSKESLRGAYALCWMKGASRPLIWWMDRAEIETHRLRSPAKDSGPWANPDDYPWMCLKTVIRAAYKVWPVGTEAQRAAKVEEDRDAGVAGLSGAEWLKGIESAGQVLDSSFVEPEGGGAPAKSSKLDALSEQLDQQKEGPFTEAPPTQPEPEKPAVTTAKPVDPDPEPADGDKTATIADRQETNKAYSRVAEVIEKHRLYSGAPDMAAAVTAAVKQYGKGFDLSAVDPKSRALTRKVAWQARVAMRLTVAALEKEFAPQAEPGANG